MAVRHSRTSSSLLAFSLVLASAGIARGQAAAAGAPGDQEIRAMKEKVALATRMLTREGIVGSSGHVSMRIPRTNRVLVGPAEVTRDILTADDIVTVDLDGNQVEGKRRKPGETEIHVGIYRARPDVMSVIHTHPVHSVTFSVTNRPLLPISVHGAIFADGVPVFDHVGHVNSRELGDGLARTLGKHRAALIKMHGAAITGASLEEAFVASIQLEENAEKQLWAEATVGPGGKVQPMTPAEAQRSVEQSFGAFSIQKRWRYYVDREELATGRSSR